MKANLFLILLTSITILGCASAPAKQSFEGEITYKVKVVAHTGNNELDDYYRKRYGNKMVLTVDRWGNFKRTYLGSGEKGYDFFIYHPQTNNYYVKSRNLDSIYVASAGINALQFIEEKNLERQKILNEDCNGYSLSGMEPRSGQVIRLTYYYPEDKEYINPEIYKGYNDFFQYQIMQKMKAPYYKLQMDMGGYEVIFEIEEINPRKVRKDEFELPRNFHISQN